MKIIVPDYFYNNNNYNLLNVDDLTFVKYRIVKNEKNLQVLLESNLLIIVLNGNKIVEFDNEKIELIPGDIAFLKSGNYIMNQIINKSNNIYESLLIFISNDFIKEFIDNNLKLFDITDDKDYNNKYYIIKVDPLLKSSIESIFPYLIHNSNYSKKILRLKLYELLYNLINNNYSNDLKKIIIDIMNNNNLSLNVLMNNNYTKPMNQKDFARLSGRSLTKFKKDFKKKFNTTFKKWIDNKRLERSMFLLNKSDYNITEICYLCGFENLSSFIQIFKKKFGITPKQFQKNNNRDVLIQQK